ncbi:MAG: hypothetical protein ABW170_17655 [Candidatus Thiodiazotropha sp. L084R]
MVIDNYLDLNTPPFEDPSRKKTFHTHGLSDEKHYSDSFEYGAATVASKNG